MAREAGGISTTPAPSGFTVRVRLRGRFLQRECGDGSHTGNARVRAPPRNYRSSAYFLRLAKSAS